MRCEEAISSWQLANSQTGLCESGAVVESPAGVPVTEGQKPKAKSQLLLIKQIRPGYPKYPH